VISADAALAYFGPGFSPRVIYPRGQASKNLVEAIRSQARGKLYCLHFIVLWVITAITCPWRQVRLPAGPGLGREPDPDVIEAYRVPDAGDARGVAALHRLSRRKDRGMAMAISACGFPLKYMGSSRRRAR